MRTLESLMAVALLGIATAGMARADISAVKAGEARATSTMSTLNLETPAAIPGGTGVPDFRAMLNPAANAEAARPARSGSGLPARILAGSLAVGLPDEAGRCDRYEVKAVPTNAIPEPNTLALLGTGFLPLAGLLRRRLRIG